MNEIDRSFWAISLKARNVGRDFCAKLKDQWNQRAERPKNYGQKRNWSAFEAEPVLERMSEHFQSDLETLKKRGIRGNPQGGARFTLCWDHAGLSHDEIATLFRMPSSNSMDQTIRRTKTYDGQTLEGRKESISHKLNG